MHELNSVAVSGRQCFPRGFGADGDELVLQRRILGLGVCGNPLQMIEIRPRHPCLSIGFLTGHELTRMPEALRILRDELPNIDVMISSQYSPQLADAIVKGNVDAAFLRREQGVPELAFRPLVKETLVVVLPSDHRLAKRKAISPGDLVGETFVGVSHTAPVLRAVIDDYLKRSGINITPDHETEHVVMGVSLIASTGGVGLLPVYAKNFLTRSVTSRPLKGDTPARLSITVVVRKFPLSLIKLAAGASSLTVKVSCPMAANRLRHFSIGSLGPADTMNSLPAAAASGRPKTGAAI